MPKPSSKKAEKPVEELSYEEALAELEEIVSALEKRYGKKIEAELDVDPELLGGARVQVGDQVIHASVRDALAQMAAALTR